MRYLYILLLFSLKAFSQTTYTPPQFNGGREAFYKYLQRNVSYPPMDREARNEPNLTATIVISKEGKIKFVNVLGNSVDGKKEVKRVLTFMPEWIPAKLNGIAIDTTVIQKIWFSINRSRVKENDTTICEIASFEVAMGSKEAAEFFKQSKQSEAKRKSIDSLYTLGVTASNNNDFTSAIKFFNQAKDKGLSSADLYYNLGVVYIKSGNKDMACTSFHEAAKKGDDESFKLYNKMCK